MFFSGVASRPSQFVSTYLTCKKEQSAIFLKNVKIVGCAKCPELHNISTRQKFTTIQKSFKNVAEVSQNNCLHICVVFLRDNTRKKNLCPAKKMYDELWENLIEFFFRQMLCCPVYLQSWMALVWQKLLCSRLCVNHEVWELPN